ncbi:MAG: Flp family type IVb pilin [Caulobacter sp.]|uniref:Flp family type IVb pilin n=1 Tax=Caulobacter sp. CCH9-E1 TaxID=1768768 RepID=UPI000AD61372|nr:Flp family type IVb pilin [Caulobacter sp. CCH9-E1]MCK5910534.1 Flp family type IVb pilin [Caulobacter sp.]
MTQLIKAFAKDETGVAGIQYGLFVALIAAVTMVCVTGLGIVFSPGARVTGLGLGLGE